jgi:hypothetical protein
MPGCGKRLPDYVTVRGVLESVEPHDKWNHMEYWEFENGTKIEVDKSNWPQYLGQDIEVTYGRFSQRITNVRVIDANIDDGPKAECVPREAKQ